MDTKVVIPDHTTIPVRETNDEALNKAEQIVQKTSSVQPVEEIDQQAVQENSQTEKAPPSTTIKENSIADLSVSRGDEADKVSKEFEGDAIITPPEQFKEESFGTSYPTEEREASGKDEVKANEGSNPESSTRSPVEEIHLDLDESSSVPEVHKKAMEDKSYYVEDESDVTKQGGSSEKECLVSLELNEDRLNGTNKNPEETSNVDKNIDKESPTANEHETAEAEKTEPEVKDQTSDTEVNIGVAEHCDEKTNLVPPEVTSLEETKSKGKSERDFDASPENVILERADSHPDSEVEPLQEVAEAEKTGPEVRDRTSSTPSTAEVQSDIASSKGSLDEHCDEKTDVAPTVVTEATSLEEHESNEKALRALDASPEALEKSEINDSNQDSEANSTELGEGSHVVAQLPFLEDDKANNGISLQEKVDPSSATEQLEETETAQTKQQDAEDEDVKHGETIFEKYDTIVAEGVKAEIFKEQTTEEKSSGQEQQIISEERGSVNNADPDITFIQSDQATPSTDGTKETETTTPTADHSQVPEASTSTKTVEEEAGETAQKPEETFHEINAVGTECSDEKAITAPTEASTSTKTVEEDAGETAQKPEETAHEINAEGTECSDEKAITAPTEASTSTKMVEEDAGETAQKPEETVHEINAEGTECSEEKAITAPTEASTSTKTVEEEAGETAQKPEETVHEINAEGTECSDEKAITAPAEASTSTKTVEEDAGETAQKPEETVHEINAEGTECSDEKTITAPTEVTRAISFGENKLIEEPATTSNEKPVSVFHASSEAMNTDTQETTDKCQDSEVDSMKLEESSSVAAQLPKNENEEEYNGNNKETTSIEEEVQENVEASKIEPGRELRDVDRARESEAETQNDLLETTDAAEDGVSMSKIEEDPEKKSGITFREPEESVVLEGKDAAPTDTLTTEDKYEEDITVTGEDNVVDNQHQTSIHHEAQSEESSVPKTEEASFKTGKSSDATPDFETTASISKLAGQVPEVSAVHDREDKKDDAASESSQTTESAIQEHVATDQAASIDIASRESETDTDQVLKDHGLNSKGPREIGTECDTKEDTEQKQRAVDKQFQVESTGEDTEKYITDGEHPTSNSTSLSTADESDYVGQAYENRLNKFTEEESCTKSDGTKTTDEEVINLAPSPSLEPTASDSSAIEKQMISEERGSINNEDLDVTFIQSDQVTASTNGTKETETTPMADHSQVPEASTSTKTVEEEAGETAQKPVDISSSGLDASEETVHEINAEDTECSDEKTITAPTEVTRAISIRENKLIDEPATTSNEEPVSVFHASSEAMDTDKLDTTDRRQDSEVSSMKLDESSSVVAQLPKHENEEANNGNNKETTSIEEGVQENVEASKTEPESELRVVDRARENEAENQNDLLETTDAAEDGVSMRKIDEDPKKKSGITFREPEESVMLEGKDAAPADTLTTEDKYEEDITVTGEDNVVDNQHQTSIHHEAQSEESSVPKTEAESFKTEKSSDATPDFETTASISKLAGQVPEVSAVHDREDKKDDAARESSQTTESDIQEHVATDQAVSIDIASRETETDPDQVVKDHGLNSEGPREISTECDTNEDSEQKQQEVDKQFQVDSTGEDSEKYKADEELPTSNSTSLSTAVEPDYVGQAYEHRLNKSTEEESCTKSDGTKTTDEEVIDLAPNPSLEPTASDSSEIESQIHKAAKDINQAPEVPPSAKAVVEEPQNAAENPIQISELMFETSDENVKELNVEVDEISESKDQVDTEIHETEVNLAEGEAGKKEINNQTEAPETIIVGETGSSQIEEESINKENVDLTAIKSDEATASTDATTEIDIAKAADLNLPPTASTLEKAPEKETEKPMEEHVNASSPWFGAALTGMYNYFKPEDKHQNEAQHEELSEESLTQKPEAASPIEGTACNTASETITGIKDPEPVEIPRSISHDTSEDAAVSDDIGRNPTPEEENLSLKDVDEKTSRVDTEVFSKSGNDTNFDHPVIAKTVNVVGEKQNEASMSNLEGQVPEVFAVHQEEDKNDGEICGASKSTENTTPEDISYEQFASTDVASAKSEVENDQLEKDHTQDVEHKKTAAYKEIGLETRGDDIEKLITEEERGLYSTNVDAGEEQKTESSQEDAILSKITETEVLETNDETRHVDEIVQDKLTTQSAEPADDPKVLQNSQDKEPQVNVVIQAREVCEAARATATIEEDYIGELPTMTVEPKTGKDLTGANEGDSTISVEEGVEKTFGASYLTHEGQDSSQDVAKVNVKDPLLMNEVNEKEKDPERQKFSYGNIQESEDIPTETEISKVAYLNPTSEASTLITVPEEETENAIEKPHDIPSSGLDTLGEKVRVENVEPTEEGDETTSVAPEIATEAMSLEEDKSDKAVEAFDVNSDSISIHTLNTIDMNQDAEIDGIDREDTPSMVAQFPTHESEKPGSGITNIEEEEVTEALREPINHGVEEVRETSLAVGHTGVSETQTTELVESSGVISHLPTQENEKTENKGTILEKSDTGDVETAETIPHAVVKDEKLSSDDVEVKDTTASDTIAEANSIGDEEINAEVQSTKLVESSGMVSHLPTHEHEKTKNESLIEDRSDAVDVETEETIPEVVVKDKKSSSDDDEVKDIPPTSDAVPEVNSTGDEEIDAEVQSTKLVESSDVLSHLPTHEHEKTKNESLIEEKSDAEDVETAETIPEVVVKDKKSSSDDDEAKNIPPTLDAVPEVNSTGDEEIDAEVQRMKLAESSEVVSLPMNEHEITENEDIVVEKSDVAYIETAKTIPDAVVKDERAKSDNAEVRNISTSDAIPAAGSIVEEIHPGVQSTNLVDSSSVESHLPKHEPEKTEIEIIIPDKSDVADIKTAETLEGGVKDVTEIHETYTSPTLGETGMDEIEKQVDKVLETSRNVDDATRQTLHQEEINKQFPESSALFHPNQDSDITTTKEEGIRVHEIGEVASLDPEETSRNESQLSETKREIANDTSMEKVIPEDVQVEEVITPDAIPECNKSGIEEIHERGASQTAESTGRDKNEKEDLEESETAGPGYQFDETDERQTSYQSLPVIKLLEELQASEKKDPTDMEVDQSSLKVTDNRLPRSLATESEQALTSSTTEGADSNEVKAKEALSSEALYESEAGVEEVHEIEASPTAGGIEKDGSEEEKETGTYTGKEEDHVTVTKFETTANTEEAGLYENLPESFEKSATEEQHSQDKITRELQVTDFDVAARKDAAETELEGQNAARREPSLVENQTHIQTTEYADSPAQSEELIIQDSESKEEGISDFQNQNSASENLLEDTGEKFAQAPVSEISRSCILDSGEAEMKEPLKAAILEQSELRDVSNHTNEISVGVATKQDEFNEEAPVATNSGPPDEVPVPETKQEDDLGEENITGRNSATTPEIQRKETFHESEKDGTYKSIIQPITAEDQTVKDATQVLVGHSSDKTKLPGEGKDGENTSGGKDVKLDLEDQKDETALKDKELEVPTIKEQVKESITELSDFEKLPEISNEDQGLQSISEGKVTGKKQVATNSDADSPSEENQLSLADPEFHVESGKAGQNTNDLDTKATQETTGQDVATGTKAPVTEVENSEVMSRSNEDTNDKNKLSTELGKKQTDSSPIFGEHSAEKAHTEKVQSADSDANNDVSLMQDYTAAASYQEAEVQGLKSEAALAAEAVKEAPYEKDAVDKENKEQAEKNTTPDSDGIQSTNKETQTVESAVGTEEFQADTAEIAQVEAAKADEEEEGDEHNGMDSSFDSPVMVEASSKDIDVKTPPKKSHNILSGVGSKVKHSIAKVKKVITGKSPNPKTPPKEDKKQVVSPSAKTH